MSTWAEEETSAKKLMPPSPSTQCWVDGFAPGVSAKSSSLKPLLKVITQPIGVAPCRNRVGSMIETWLLPSFAVGVVGSSESSTTRMVEIVASVGWALAQVSTGPVPRTWMSPLGPTATSALLFVVVMSTFSTWPVSTSQVVAALAAGARPSANATAAVTIGTSFRMGQR